MLPVGKRAVICVYIRLEGFYKPIHVLFTPAADFLSAHHKIKRRILRQTAVTFVVALRRGDDKPCARTVEIFRKPPAFAVRGFLIGKQIVPVEHVHNGIPVLYAVVTVGQINIGFTLAPARQRGNFYFPIVYQTSVLNLYATR